MEKNPVMFSTLSGVLARNLTPQTRLPNSDCSVDQIVVSCVHRRLRGLLTAVPRS
jgi:hypothetical protein